AGSTLHSVRVAGFCVYFFFFQAEDGIRDFHVTGVQTCALPISTPEPPTPEPPAPTSRPAPTFRPVPPPGPVPPAPTPPTRGGPRSEERRVGKECRARWASEQYKKKRYACKRVDLDAWSCE